MAFFMVAVAAAQLGAVDQYACQTVAAKAHRHCNAAFPVAIRVRLLLDELTQAEKFGLMGA